MDSYSLMEIKGGVYSYVNNLLKPTLRVSVCFLQFPPTLTAGYMQSTSEGGLH